MSNEPKTAEYDIGEVDGPLDQSFVSDDANMQRMGKNQSFQVSHRSGHS